jgi:hypothetical protein
MVETIACRLKLSKRESKLLRLLVEWHMQPLFGGMTTPLPGFTGLWKCQHSGN